MSVFRQNKREDSCRQDKTEDGAWLSAFKGNDITHRMFNAIWEASFRRCMSPCKAVDRLTLDPHSCCQSQTKKTAVITAMGKLFLIARTIYTNGVTHCESTRKFRRKLYGGESRALDFDDSV